MPYPNETVVNAIFESYLSMRKTSWGVEDKDGKLTTPEKESDADHKIQICAKILQPASGYLTSKGWLDLIDTLYQQEKAEQEYLDNLWFIRRWYGSKVLLETLRAARSYIIASYKESSAYLDHMAKLQKEKRDAGIIYNSVRNLPESNKPEDIEKAKKRYDEATEALKPFDLDDILKKEHDHIHYFQNHILGHDPLALELKEATFDDFVNNAMNYKRRRDLCQKLLDNSRASKETAPEPVKSVEAPKPVPAPVTQPKIVEVSKPAPAPVVNPVVAAPVAAPRRSTRHKQAETSTSTSSALRNNSTFAAPTSTTAHRKTNNSKKSSNYYGGDTSSDEEYFVPKSKTNW